MTKDSPAAPFLDRLYRRSAHGIKMGLEAMEGLAARLDHPERAFVCVHVAGTNGKGSVCAIMERALRAAGWVTGLYTSPHLVRFNERIRVGGAAVSDADLAGLIRRVDAADRDQVAAGGREATFFEFSTAMAFEHFRRSGVQIAVLETGLGGRLDATNIVRPLLSVITRIGIEHTEYLGTTLEQIAGEKAGIVKPGVPVVLGAMPAEARGVIERTARERRAPCVAAEEAVNVRSPRATLDGQSIQVETAGAVYGPLILPLPGAHQLENAATAVAALEYLGSLSSFSCDEAAIRSGLERVWWPARFQVLSRDPAVILDGAHNPDAARVLADTLKRVLGRRELALVVGLLADKDLAGFMRELTPRVKRAWAVQIRNERTLPLDRLVAGIRAAGLEVEGLPLRKALRQAREWAAQRDGAVCVAGSLFLAGEVFETMGIHDLDVLCREAEKEES
ncbi:MAG TPA: folylpolyglutamate synthase/dihydrofolate synthase family protein [Kiritimatiellia bacterium]|nr:folylpolyglutamate synthase/dihydrofolate synthase family protein [Kiritimatiellia bacterium]HRZ11902.1 folylpolyglutamate synthase/dihydrofolate synthase family protein [Kiritimatiellia bacterium]HSA17292.1 folylpolyglutamate synthase/dihydrofolate synthase family protein [Kiritimatiellia bacterium]